MGRWRHGILLLLTFEEVLSGATDVVKSYDTVDRGILDRVLSSLGLAWLVSSCLF